MQALMAYKPEAAIPMLLAQKKLKEVKPFTDPASGKPMEVAFYEDGSREVLPFGTARQMEMINLGNRTVAVDKANLAPGTEFQPGLSPDQTANIQLRIAEMQKPVFNAEAGGYVPSLAPIPRIAGINAGPTTGQIAQPTPSPPRMAPADNLPTTAPNPTRGPPGLIPLAGFTPKENAADVKKEDQKKKDLQAIQAVEMDAGVIGKNVDEALSLITGTSTGLPFKVMKNISTSDAAKLASAVDTLKGRQVITTIERMKDVTGSASGGSAGRSREYLNLLESSIAGLHPEEGPVALRKGLNDVQAYYTKWLDVMRSNYRNTYNEDVPSVNFYTPESSPVDLQSAAREELKLRAARRGGTF
jgi:hypothetical protein